MPEPAASRAHRAASAPCPCPARPPRAWPRPAPPRPVHCSQRAGAGQAAARRGSEPRGGAGSQGPAEERGGPDGCQRGGRAWMRREPEASSSRRRLCPRAPYGLKVSARRTERQAAGTQAGLRERRELGGRRDWDQKFVRPLWCRLPGTDPLTVRPSTDSPSGRLPWGPQEH